MWAEGGAVMSTEYGDMIRQLRTAAGLTQKALGEACGYIEASAERSVRHWESGRSYPPIEMLRALAQALHVPVESLIP